MTTKSDDTNVTPLSSAQIVAIDELATGASITDAAKKAKTARQTVSGWVNKDADFQAALNLRRRELWDEQKDRFRSLLPVAFETLELAMTNGKNVKVALAVLKMVNVDFAPIGLVDAEEIEMKRESQKRNMMLRYL